jgi:hypothetical protein
VQFLNVQPSSAAAGRHRLQPLLVFVLLALFACPLMAADPYTGTAAADLPSVLGIPIDFILFASVLIGIALFHHYTLPIAVGGLAVFTLY